MPDFKKRVAEAAAFIDQHCADQPLAGARQQTGNGLVRAVIADKRGGFFDPFLKSGMAGESFRGA